MANIHVGTVDVFSDAIFAQPHPNTLQFLQQHLERPSMLLDNVRDMFQRSIQQTYDAFHSSNAMRIARAAMRGMENYWQANVIQPLTTIGQLQHATPVMQRWVMAEPTVRDLYFQQRLDGYNDSYVNTHGEVKGEEHYDWRRVMNGVVVFDEKAEQIEDQTWHATTWFEDLLPDDRELLMEEQDDILLTWQRVREYIAQGKEDPTSRWNADLG